MKTIMGLMLKDLFIFKSYKKNIIFSILVFIFMIGVASLETNMITVGAILFLIVFGMNSISTFSYDEMAESDRYFLSLPITRKEIVQAKYLFAFLNSSISLIFGFLISLIITLFVTQKVPILNDSIKLCFLAFTSVSFLICTDTPCIYKWGVEKGRMQAVIVPIILFFGLGLISFIPIILFPTILKYLTLDNLYEHSLEICIVLNILFYFVSYFISCRIFLNKDL